MPKGYRRHKKHESRHRPGDYDFDDNELVGVIVKRLGGRPPVLQVRYYQLDETTRKPILREGQVKLMNALSKKTWLNPGDVIKMMTTEEDGRFIAKCTYSKKEVALLIAKKIDIPLERTVDESGVTFDFDTEVGVGGGGEGGGGGDGFDIDVENI